MARDSNGAGNRGGRRIDVVRVGHRRLYRLDDMRRFGAELASTLGVAPARASAFVSGLLWYDAADAASFGIDSLPGWLDAIHRGEIDPKAEGTIRKEHPATAVFDGARGLAPLILGRAAQVAQEKARELGVGVVRVVNLGRSGPAAEVASEIAVGPMVGTVRGPGPSLAVAVPVAGSVPAVFDSRLGAGPSGSIAGPPGWATPFAEAGDWLVMAESVNAFETLASFHERVMGMVASSPPSKGEVRPGDWQTRRLEHIERGFPLGDAARGELNGWAERLGVAWPEPWGEG